MAPEIEGQYVKFSGSRPISRSSTRIAAPPPVGGGVAAAV